MPTWQYTIDLKQEWEQAQEGVIACKDLIKVITTRFEDLPEDLQDNFSIPLSCLTALAKEAEESGDDVDVDTFDEIWQDVYNIADANRVWLKTLF